MGLSGTGPEVRCQTRPSLALQGRTMGRVTPPAQACCSLVKAQHRDWLRAQTTPISLARLIWEVFLESLGDLYISALWL